MLFPFIRYLQPTRYFELYKKNRTSIFPIPEKLPKEILGQLEEDSNFKSEVARRYDLSWQAIHKGYIGNAETYTSFKKVPIDDEYRFLQKYFHPVWVFYVLILRIITFKNPLLEVTAWRKSKSVTRSNYLLTPIKHAKWNLFTSSIIVEKPLVSVVIPTLNRYEYLKDILSDFERQTYTNIEILIIDQSDPFQNDFCKDFNLAIRHIHQKEPALWLARNTAIKESRGNIIALSEDDVRISPDWIENHLKVLDFFKADISAGGFLSRRSFPSRRTVFFLFSISVCYWKRHAL